MPFPVQFFQYDDKIPIWQAGAPCVAIPFGSALARQRRSNHRTAQQTAICLLPDLVFKELFPIVGSESLEDKHRCRCQEA